MTDDERFKKAEKFLEEFRDLVHRYAGSDYFKADPLLLIMIQERTSVYNPFIWPDV